MSLLLDALKKVERNKHVIATSKSSNLDNDNNAGKEVNLDLDLIDSSEVDSDYEEKKKVDLRKSIVRKEKIDKVKTSDYVVNMEVDEGVHGEIKDDSKQDDNLSLDQEKKNKDYYTQSSDALRELIHKSNDHSIKKKRIYRKRIYISTVIGLAILIAFYGYQLMSVTSDIVDIKEMENRKEITSVPFNGIAEQTKEVSGLNDNTTIGKNIKSVNNRMSDSKRPVSRKTVSKKVNKQVNRKITIKHEIKTDPVESNIIRAYDYFQSGDYLKSRDLYELVIISEPGNRDALLGLAAIAIKNNDIELAKEVYKEILYLYPKDSIAHSGLTGLVENNSVTYDESRLKLLIKQQPNESHLYFSLATVYVRQKKWSDAQKEFFKAWSRDRRNPDYAFNLAVSLDHLNKHKEAKEFYELSLDLATDKVINFSKEDVIKRVKMIDGKK